MIDVRHLNESLISKVESVLKEYGVEAAYERGAGFKVQYQKYPRFCMVSFDPKGFMVRVAAPGGLGLDEAQQCSEELNAAQDILTSLFTIDPALVYHDPSKFESSGGSGEGQEDDSGKPKFEVGFFRVMCFSTQCSAPCPLNTFMLLNRAKSSFEYRLGPKHCGSTGWAKRKKWVERKNEAGEWEILEDTRTA